ncbi:MAG: CBS domain-containing protein [bacterium]|nr:CBS domain-containing protein [bacterium]
MLTVKEVLERKGTEVESIAHDAMASEAVRTMNDKRIGSLVVIKEGRMIGIVTERDVMRRLLGEGRAPETTRVEQIMSTPVACCRFDTTLDECRKVMRENRIRRLPVVEEGKLQGIITIGDLQDHEIEDGKKTIERFYEIFVASPLNWRD